MLAGGSNKAGNPSMRVRYRLRYVGQDLEYVQDPDWFMAVMEMRAQECYLVA